MALLSKAPTMPLIISGAAFLTQTALKGSFNNLNPDMDSSSPFNSLFDPHQSSSQPTEASDLANLEVFGDYLTFMFLSIIFSLIIVLFGKARAFLSRQATKPINKNCQLPTGHQFESFEVVHDQPDNQPDHTPIKLRIRPLISITLCYTLAFCFIKIALLFCAFSTSVEKIPLTPRILQEYEADKSEFTVPDTPEKISFAMGRTVASFDVEPTIITMSQDEKWTYVSTENPQLIRIYDTSDFKTSKQVASVNLGYVSRTRMFLELSADGTILVASNYVDVKIIDVSNPRYPRLIGSFESPMYPSSDNMVFVSMFISPDNKYLFMAEVGFAILDISNPANIFMVYSSVKRGYTGTGNLVSLAASKDGKLLYLANGQGALEVYHVTNPTQPVLASRITFPSSTVASVFLSKSGNIAYVAGMSNGKYIEIGLIDISNPWKIKVVSQFLVGTLKSTSPIIQALSPRETKLYIVQQKLMVIDLTLQDVESSLETVALSANLLSICFSPSGKYFGMAYLQQLVFLELFEDYPNSKIFTPSNSSAGSFILDRRFESWAMSGDGNLLYAAFNDYERKKSSFEIWNIADKSNLERTASLGTQDLGVNLTAPLLTFKISQDNKRVYLKWWTRETSMLIILDVSGDKPIKLKEYFVPLSLNFEDFAFSKNEKILCIAPSANAIVLYDLTSPKQNIFTIPASSGLKSNNFDLDFVKDDTVLLVITSKISFYDVQDISNPKYLGSISMTEGGSPRILSTAVVEEQDCLIVEWYQTSRKLRVYNLTDIMAPKLVSELSLPKRNFNSDQDILQEFYGPFVYIESGKMGFVGTIEKLLRVDLSDLKNPTILGTVPVALCRDCGNTRFIISPDGNMALVTNQTGMLNSLNLNTKALDLYSGTDSDSFVFATSLQIRTTLYIPQEKYLLGERYSDNIFVLENNAETHKYEMALNAGLKVLKLYSHEIKVISSEISPKILTSSLPDWMKFNQDNLLLTVEPKSKKDLGVYTVCAAISYKIYRVTLSEIGPENDYFKVDEILTTLISMGYVDRELYLTTNFGTRESFFLPEKYDKYKGEIHDILNSFYTEDCTKVQVLPSLNVEVLKDKIRIDTTTTEVLKVDITLVSENQSAQFLSKAYGPLIPEIRDQKSRIVLEGNLHEIHLALQNAVINTKQGAKYDGIITIHDGLNYPIERKLIKDISECFLKNSPPSENPNATKTFQEQLDRVSVATGQYFTITWDEKTFVDPHSEALHYEVTLDNDGTTGKPKAFPDWLTFSGLALRGTPPEKISGREIALKFIMRNEFQSTTIPFKLKIGISPTFALSLLIKYSPMLLTALGFYIKANRIYNIVAKKRYKHAKDYQVQVGEEMALFPILLIENELRESQAIMKHLLKYLKKGKEAELVSHFVDEGTRTLDKNKIISSIDQFLSDLPSQEKKKLPIYLDGSDFSRKKILQIIFNKIIMLQLESPQEKPTKKMFETIKEQWADLVEWDPELLFMVNKHKLSEFLDKKNNNSLRTEEESPSLLGEYRQEINQDLLQDALISHTFSHQSIDARSTMVLVEIFERVSDGQGFKSYLKRDLEGFHLNSQAAIDYGVNCQFDDGMLVFSGTPKPNFKGRTLAVQIQNIQCRILKEIWIQEKSTGNGSSTIELSSRTESSLRGKSYEVY